MNGKLAAFLQGNKESILENWLAETEMPSPNPALTHGEAPYDFLEELYEEIINLLNLRQADDGKRTPFHTFMDFTFTCTPGNGGCVELHRAGQRALRQSLEQVRRGQHTFTKKEKVVYRRLLDNALAVLMHREIEECAQICPKPFCPFTKEGMEKDPTSYEFLGHGLAKASAAP